MTIIDLKVPCGISSIFMAQALWSSVALIIHGFLFFFNQLFTVHVFIMVWYGAGLTPYNIITQCSRYDDESAASATEQRIPPFLAQFSTAGPNGRRPHLLTVDHRKNVIHSFSTSFFLLLDTILDGISCVCASCT